MRTTIVISLAFLCLSGAGPNSQAVVPPPDGGYPNFTTAEGQKALQSLTTGAANTAVGWYSLFSDTAGSFNTATGVGALLFNTANENTAFGAATLLFNTTGEQNTATGDSALLNNTTGFQNTANGALALFSNTTGNFNTAIGESALMNNTAGSDNIAIGNGALFNNSIGEFNTAVGEGALNLNTTGNTNVVIGAGAGGGVLTADNVICIGATVAGNNVSNTCFIGNIRGVATHNANAIPVLIDSVGQLGTMSSSRRFKSEIKSMDSASETVLALKPVTFHYKSDARGTPQFGLIAEEVAEVNPDLVVRDEDGEIYSVRYEAVNAMLLNEFLKEHRKVEKLQATVAELAEQLQKVSAQVEMNSSVAKVAGK